ncbi:hypothetical protein HWB05_gp019 [Streptomyces phage BRock]|uniref:Uncharacterized protein n=1 Tax=Streptomyces phage BRock TaxID=1913591 RepID=A0A1J0GVR8_9CAUD|nr:hypothetical protein HWB05_gp019 [Streptomyces phage BRock]APC46281.2 hypothetical protein [Streptomyces phage BRock]
MDKLTIARRVATNPNMRALTAKRDRMFNRMRADYGKDFMGLDYANLPVDEAGRDEAYVTEMNTAKEGVNRWTRPERTEYMRLERQIKTYRDMLTAHYANNV